MSSAEDLRRFPGNYHSIADLYAHFGKYDEAIEYLNKVLSNNKGNVFTHSRLAEVYEKIGKYEDAIQEYLYLSKEGGEGARKKGLEGLKKLEKRKI